MANDTTSPVAAPIEGPPVTGTGKKPGFRDSAGYGPIITFASVVSLLLLWQGGSGTAAAQCLCRTAIGHPGAVHTDADLRSFWQDMGKTLQRIAFAFLLAMGGVAVSGLRDGDVPERRGCSSGSGSSLG